ncbi:hypothetical protein M1C59_18640 [Gordonia terrae]|uniref:hypothetical protein n=1 Tax=Gordonia terrae TaxID=2055 RepID=UPI00200A67DA|nr:hypothetical protein [Gordonia terrae]UPW08057.1 hypothetical protein M1C59_18640 [Gordonia terrae]
MEIRVEAHTVRVRERSDLRDLEVRSAVDEIETSERLRQRGIGYVDGDAAYINTLWLQSLNDDRRWRDEVRELLAFAECHGWFDGVYLRARFTASGAPRVRPGSPVRAAR